MYNARADVIATMGSFSPSNALLKLMVDRALVAEDVRSLDSFSISLMVLP